MTKEFAFAGPIIALAAMFSIPAVFTTSSGAAESCIAAPKLPSPEGSYWRYRLDRATQRKCWHLVKLDQQPQRTAKRAAPQPEQADEQDATPAPEPATTSERVQPVTQHGWLTRSASAVSEPVAPTQGPIEPIAERADDRTTPPVSVAQETVAPKQASEATPRIPPVPAAEPQRTNSAAQNSAPVPARPGMTQFVFAAIAGTALVAAVIFFLIALRRRRGDVLTRITREDAASADVPEAEAPTFSPIPPMRLAPQHDDVDEALQRRARRRMAA